MSKKLDIAVLQQTAVVHDSPPRHTVDRTMGLPVGVYAALGACYFGFLGTLSIGLMDPGLAIPVAICFLFLVMFGGCIALWVRMSPANSSQALTWAQFKRQGIMTYTGRMSAPDAIGQIMTVPVLLFAWGVFVTALCATF